MARRRCFHCNAWVDDDQAHDCWTTTERALTQDLADDLQEAWARLRETAVEFGDQRIYASHHSIMFSRTSCYFFVRPKRQYLEVCIFLGRPLSAPQVRSIVPSSKVKYAHLLRITHRDDATHPARPGEAGATTTQRRLDTSHASSRETTESGEESLRRGSHDAEGTDEVERTRRRDRHGGAHRGDGADARR